MKQRALTEEQVEYIQSLFDYCELKDLKKLKTAEELQLFASYHSREGGEHAYRWVIENAACDKGTALMIYWRAAPLDLYSHYALEKEVPAHALDIYQTIKEIEKRVSSGFYKTHRFFYDPAAEGYLPSSFNAKKLKQPIPEQMLSFEHGAIWEDPLEQKENY